MTANGRPASSGAPKQTARAKVVEALTRDGLLSEDAAADAAFHLTDWDAELKQLLRVFSNRRWDPAAAQRVLVAFVGHTTPHLVAAFRIIYGLQGEDTFGIGAVKGSGRAKRELANSATGSRSKAKRKKP